MLRGVRATAWVAMDKELRSTKQRVRQAIGRAERLADRMTSRQGTPAPSPSQAVLTGTNGAIAAWAVAKGGQPSD